MSLRPLIATAITKSYPSHTVLDGVDLTAAPGQRIGLVGENGVGKSTLLRVLAGVDEADAGSVDVPADLAYVPQEPPFVPDQTVGAVLAEALAPLHDAVRDVERLSAVLAHDPSVSDEFNDRLEWARNHDAWDANRRAALAVKRLGLGEVERDRPVGELSGGQRTRLALAAVITRQPECVLLDEPTNHLDDEAMELLETFLAGLPGVVVAASHDRVFLDRVCTHIVDLDPSALGTDGRGGTRYSGAFADFLAHKAAARRRWEDTYATQQKEITRLRQATRIGADAIAHDRGPRDNDKFIYKFKGGKVDRALARRKHDAQRRLETAERDQLRKPRPLLQFAAPLTVAGPAEVAVAVRDLDVPGRVRLPRLDVAGGTRLLVTGHNGSGKSSLLHVLAGELAPTAGTVAIGARRVGLLPQDVEFADGARPAIDTYAAAAGPDSPSLTDLGLLHPRDVSKPVAALSVGQRRRLALAVLVAQAPDLLLLDEPTNHISLALASELEDALGTSAGTVVVASHDRWLRRRWDGPTLQLPAAA